MAIELATAYLLFAVPAIVTYLLPFCFTAFYVMKSISRFNMKVGFKTLNPFHRFKQQLELRSQDPDYASIGNKVFIWIAICFLSWTVGTSILLRAAMYVLENRVVVIVDQDGNEIDIPNISTEKNER